VRPRGASSVADIEDVKLDAMATADKLVAGHGPRLAELCAEARRAHPDLAIDDRDLVAAIASRATGDVALYLERCHAAEFVLALAASQSTPAAIELVERTHAAMIGATCHRFAGRGHTQDDLRQILRAKLFVAEAEARPKIVDYDGQGSLASWLRVTAVRLFIDLTRRKDRAREAAISDDTPEVIAPADLALDAIKAEYREAVAAALVEAARRLDAGDRHLLRQHLVAGLSIDQLGSVLGVHRATAARRLARAREQLAATARELLAARLTLDDHELVEVYSLVVSKLDLSIARMLATPQPGPASS